MPVGIQRLNARKSQPNPHIVFIKPLKGPDEEASRAFLERIAAQCVPVMREHHLSVVTLEEYEPNASFVGRNFNAGEVIQLVLKARFSGRWLPFSYVQMVMMHELAHCRHMNHARAFWAVRDGYAAHMRRLWAQDYTGEGIWGRGARLGTAAAASWARIFSEQNTAQPGGAGDGVLLEHLCGGTYRSRGRLKNKKRKPALTYREQQERRIRRKFGENGLSLGGDVAERAKLEGGGTAGSKGSSSQKRVAVKPRVAKSKRGRDLRAAAALARFEQNTKEKKEEEEEEHNDDNENQEDHEDVIALIKQEADVDSFDDDDDNEDNGGDDDSTTDQALPDAVDIDGTRLVDGQGRGMVRVCEDDRPGDGGDDGDDAGAKRELRELLQIQAWGSETKKQQPQKASLPKKASSGAQSQPRIKEETEEELRPDSSSHRRLQQQEIHKIKPAVKPEAKHESEEPSLMDIPLAATASEPASTLLKAEDSSCPVCSLANRPLSVTCAMCAHVLLPDADPSAWRCRSAACSSSSYLNAGDCRMCGVCGQRRERE